MLHYGTHYGTQIATQIPTRGQYAKLSSCVPCWQSSCQSIYLRHPLEFMWRAEQSREVQGSGVQGRLSGTAFVLTPSHTCYSSEGHVPSLQAPPKARPRCVAYLGFSGGFSRSVLMGRGCDVARRCGAGFHCTQHISPVRVLASTFGRMYSTALQKIAD